MNYTWHNRSIYNGWVSSHVLDLVESMFDFSCKAEFLLPLPLSSENLSPPHDNIWVL